MKTEPSNKFWKWTLKVFFWRIFPKTLSLKVADASDQVEINGEIHITKKEEAQEAKTPLTKMWQNHLC